MAFDPISLALSKDYTKETAEGMGAVKGEKGDPGDQGPPGKDGMGVPPGGTVGQMLMKASDADYDARWEDPTCATMDQVNDAINASITGAIKKVYYGT